MLAVLMTTALVGSAFLPVRASAQEGGLAEPGAYSRDARNARISDIRQKLKITLNDKERQLVSERCEQAQSALAKISDRLEVTAAKRTETYQSVITTLSILRASFANRQIDVSNLELLIVTYQTELDDFNDAVRAYEVALDDSVLVDCRQNPEDFRAALEGVRIARRDVVEAAQKISETTDSTLNTTLDSLRLRLQTSGGAN